MQSQLGFFQFREEARKSWDHVVSDKIVYAAQSLETNLEFGRFADSVHWLSKYHLGNIYIELKIFLFPEGNHYLNSILEIPPPGLRDSVDSDMEGGVTHGDDAMLVDIAELIQLPKGMILKRCPTAIWLKKPDFLNGSSGHPTNHLAETFLTSPVRIGMDREGGFATGLPRRASCQAR